VRPQADLTGDDGGRWAARGQCGGGESIRRGRGSADRLSGAGPGHARQATDRQKAHRQDRRCWHPSAISSRSAREHTIIRSQLVTVRRSTGLGGHQGAAPHPSIADRRRGGFRRRSNANRGEDHDAEPVEGMGLPDWPSRRSAGGWLHHPGRLRLRESPRVSGVVTHRGELARERGGDRGRRGPRRQRRGCRLRRLRLSRTGRDRQA